ATASTDPTEPPPGAGSQPPLTISVPAGTPRPTVVDAEGAPFTCECSGSQITLLPSGHPGTPGGPAPEPIPGLLPGATVVPLQPGSEGPAAPIPPIASNPSWFELYQDGITAEPTAPVEPFPGIAPGAVPAVGTPPAEPSAPSWFEQYYATLTNRTEPVGPDGLPLPPADVPVQPLPPGGILRGDDQNLIILNAGPETLILGDGNRVLGPHGDDRDVQVGGDGNTVLLDGGDDNDVAAYGDSNTVVLGDGNRNDAVVADGDGNYVEIGDGEDNNATAGRGDDNFAIVGDGDRSRALTGAGSYNTALAGNGNDNDAIAGGPGNGNTAVVGDGDRNRAIVGEGDSNVAIAGDGNGNFTRTGLGNGNATTTGDGNGNLTQVGSGEGNTANGVPVAPQDYRPFTPRPLPTEEQAPPGPPIPGLLGPPVVDDPSDGVTSWFPIVKSVESVAQSFIGKFRAQKAVLRDAATRHLLAYDRLITEADGLRAGGDPADAARADRLQQRAETRLSRAERYGGMSQRLEQITGQKFDTGILRHAFEREFVVDSAGTTQRGQMRFNRLSIHGHLPERIQKWASYSFADHLNRHPERSGRTNSAITDNRAVVGRPDIPVNDRMQRVGGFGAQLWETSRRGLVKVSGPIALAGAGFDVYNQISNGRSVEHAVAKTGSELLVGGAAGGLAAAGLAATVPGPGWVVAGGIVVGTGASMLWSYSGASEWFGGVVDGIFGD
ncbi:MAG: hypothetical protein ACT4RN_03325, partial [Pseudonocardia sp.]